MVQVRSKDLVKKLNETIIQHQIFANSEMAIIGVSGGPDSLCLLHCLLLLREDFSFRIHVAHLNHGLRGPAAAADAQFVAELAEKWGLPATIEERDVRAYARTHKLSIEEAARRVRYTFLAQVAQKVGAQRVAVGHNADDQVESVVMHWLRGAGLAGLRGMRPVQPYPLEGHSQLKLVRPLLEVTRAEIEAYCQEQGLAPRFDLSNLDTTLLRNRIRHELLPLLETYNPQIRQVLSRTSRGLADEYDYLLTQGQVAWDRLLLEEKEGTLVFDRQGWAKLHPGLQRLLLRRAIQHLRTGLRNIDWEHIEPARRALLDKPPGTVITLPQGLSLYLAFDRFAIGASYPVPEMPKIGEEPIKVAVPGSTTVGNWRLVARMGSREMVALALSNTDPWQTFMDFDRIGEELYLRRRRPGDRFQPLGMGGQEKSLHKFLIDAKILRYIRDSIPILVSPKHIVWVVGLRLDERAKVDEKTERVLHLAFQRVS